ncbi:unnamed protein product, partial [Ectocarpus sp. 12 AP-2014]
CVSCNKAGDAECTPCPIGYYGEQIAMWMCEECPDSKTTVAEGSTSQEDCV